MVAKKPARKVHFPELRDAIAAYREHGGGRSTTRNIMVALNVTIEQARRYGKGYAMPRPDKLKRLSMLIGVPVGELHAGGRLDPRRTPGVVTVPLSNVTPDEQKMIEAYRLLPPHAQPSVRAYLTKLLEEFAPPSAKNPYGQGSTQ